MLDAIASPYRQRSWSAKARHRRMALFSELIKPLSRPLHILDVGGTARYWQTFGAQLLSSCQVTLLNRGVPREQDSLFAYRAGDACNLSEFADGQFDMVFSNSVIEHVGDFARQTAMANEVRRVGKSYFVQTPARSFLIEPHYRLPLIQFLPATLRRFIARTGTKARFYPSWFAAESEWLRLLTAAEMQRLFPDATLWREKVGPLTKSFVAYRIMDH